MSLTALSHLTLWHLTEHPTVWEATYSCEFMWRNAEERKKYCINMGAIHVLFA